MCISIGIEDLVANALIELVGKAKRRSVKFSELSNYGAMVLKILNANNEEAILILSREGTNAFLHDYSEFFETQINDCDGEEEIALKNGKDIHELKKIFRGYLSLDMFLAFVSKESLKALGV